MNANRQNYVSISEEPFQFKATIGGYYFRTEPEAQEYVDSWNAFFETMKTIENVPTSLGRDEYERVCAELGIEPASDEDCNSYAVTYGQFEPPEYTGEYARIMALKRRRQAAILADIAAEETGVIAHETPAPRRDETRCHYCGGKANDKGFFGEPICWNCGG